MRTTTTSTRLLPDGTPLRNRLLGALPAVDYARIRKHLHMNTVAMGHALQEHGAPVTDVYFPNAGVFSVTNEMRDGQLVEVATVGREGMLGIGVFLGDRSGAGRTFQQVPNGPFPGELAADHAVHRLQCGARRETTVLPLVASDARSGGVGRFCPQTRIPGHHARSPSSDGDAGHGNTPAVRSDFEQVWPHTRAEKEAVGKSFV
jgi:hypothetical protein